jgi:hypothetical protein
MGVLRPQVARPQPVTVSGELTNSARAWPSSVHASVASFTNVTIYLPQPRFPARVKRDTRSEREHDKPHPASAAFLTELSSAVSVPAPTTTTCIPVPVGAPRRRRTKSTLLLWKMLTTVHAWIS